MTLHIVHAIPGRVRLKSPLLRTKDAAILPVALATVEGVHWARLNPRCDSLIVRHEQALDAQAIIRETARALGLPASSPAETESRQGVACASPGACAGKKPPKNDVRAAAWRFGGLTAALGYVVVKRLVTGGAVNIGLMSPLGAVAVVAALPLARSVLRDVRERTVRLESFLAGSVVAAIAAGEVLTALEVLWITSGGDLLKAWITERSRRAVAEILEVTAHHTFVLRDGVEVEVPVEQLCVGDVVVIHTGEKISVDGVVTDGHALVDESPLTGNAALPERAAGDHVYAGSLVRQGVLYIHAECVGDNTYLARILAMIEEGLATRAPIEGVADELARRTVRAGALATAGTFILTGSVMRAFTVLLVMACPCATALAASTAVSAAISAAARRGVLIKGGRYLEQIGGADVICFDKTGTLTTTSPRVASMVTRNGATREELLQLACSAEAHNHHPLAEALKTAAEAAGVDPTPHDVCEYFLGQGVQAVVAERTIHVGNAKLMRRFEIPLDEAAEQAEALAESGLTVLYLARDGAVLGLFGVANPLREEAAVVTAALMREGAELCLVTGDEATSVNQLAKTLGVERAYSSVMPDGKAAIVTDLQQQGSRVVMVGDGVNDALALATADVGVALGAGASEAAMEAADIALVGDDLNQLLYIRGLSRQTLAVARQNFLIASGSNVLGAAAGALGLLSPLTAGLLHIGHTLAVLGNSARLLGYERPAERVDTPENA